MRHAGVDLLTQSSAKKILLVLTDGEPADIDVDDPQHLRMDAKKAVEEFENTVTQVNDAPVIASVAPITATEDIELSLIHI